MSEKSTAYCIPLYRLNHLLHVVASCTMLISEGNIAPWTHDAAIRLTSWLVQRTWESKPSAVTSEEISSQRLMHSTQLALFIQQNS